jgi:hypothetical protein
MTLKGTVRGGVVVLEEGTKLEDGTEVEVVPRQQLTKPGASEGSVPTLYDRVKDFVGIADRMPADMAENHDHYVHGRPKTS